MIELIAATNNANKLREFRQILGNDFKVMSLKEVGISVDVEEDADTFYGNALKKAKVISELTGKASLADDSGLIVDALGGAPGVYSARYGGEDGNDVLNRQKLLKEMDGISDRKARFHSTIVLYFPSGEVIRAEGNVEGEILYEETGDNGFGYDNLFYSIDLGESFGTATEEAKNGVSHRGRALQQLVEKLNQR
ncbi:MAG: RdgB/HAM1 family non-canonical purine NTP pyrophosphatase [Clostridia bacterium]|nr:RdgB/HAM1 family non-canonical purine NTP pyrophosphatase [Clostridia bacterium]